MPSSKKFRLLICSANMGNAEPDKDSIAAWLPEDGAFHNVVSEESYESERRVRFDGHDSALFFDAIVVGMQEATFEKKEDKKESSDKDLLSSPEKILTDNVVVKGAEKVGKEVLSTVQQLAGSKDHTKKKTKLGIKTASDWVGGTKVLHEALAQRCPSYEWSVAYQRGQMRLIVLTRKDSFFSIEVETLKAENTGLASVAANKGGILAILNIHGTRLGFITAHLEAHEGAAHYQGRCSNLAEILSGTSSWSSRVTAYDASLTTHYCFVSGDLNFRTQNMHEMEKEELFQQVHAMVEAKQWEKLNEADELQKALKQKDCLVGFQTLPCHFPPTFKMKRKEGFHYKENRIPSYTDRILWKCAHKLNENVVPLAYEPIESFKTSDHKPIRGAFEINLNPEIKVAAVDGLRLSRRKSMRDLFSASHHDADNLHIFFNELSCSGLKSKNPQNKPDPYITFVSNPKELVRKEQTKWQKVKHKLRLSVRTKKKENDDGVVERTARGWTRTSKKTSDSDPDWSGEEVHLVMKAAKKGGGINDLTGALLFITVHDQTSVMEDNAIGSFALNLAHLFLASKERSSKLSASLTAGNQPSTAAVRRSSITSIFGRSRNDADVRSPVTSNDDLKILDIDEPLIKNGKEQGRIRCSIDTWWFNEPVVRTDNKRRQLKTSRFRRNTTRRNQFADGSQSGPSRRAALANSR